MKQPFLYLDSAEISSDDLAALSEQGFIPIKVKSFDDVKVLDTLGSSNGDFIVSMVDAFNHQSESAKKLRGLFADNLFKRIAENNINEG